MPSTLVALETRHPSSDWLKEIANPNMLFMFVTLETFHPFSGWLKALADLNMRLMFLALETSHRASGWLKSLANPNMNSKFVTLETSHALTSSLNFEQAALQPRRANSWPEPRLERAQKRYDMSVTPETSHVRMWPKVASAAVGSAHQTSRPTSSAARLLKTYGIAVATGT
jgi:hypothetical protein